MTYTSKGFIFSFDLFFSFITALFIVFLFFQFFSDSFHSAGLSLKKFDLWRKAVSFSDSFVNSATTSEIYSGLIFFDEEKKRAVPNLVTLSKFKNKIIVPGEVKEISFEFKDNSKEQVLSKNLTENCLVVSRFVFIKEIERKARVLVAFCE
ncbi:MAG TPA: hypothetical protein VJK05_03500 [archaeon]|nr:hypothetical protein [archaeon]